MMRGRVTLAGNGESAGAGAAPPAPAAAIGGAPPSAAAALSSEPAPPAELPSSGASSRPSFGDSPGAGSPGGGTPSTAGVLGVPAAPAAAGVLGVVGDPFESESLPQDAAATIVQANPRQRANLFNISRARLSPGLGERRALSAAVARRS